MIIVGIINIVMTIWRIIIYNHSKNILDTLAFMWNSALRDKFISGGGQITKQ